MKTLRVLFMLLVCGVSLAAVDSTSTPLPPPLSLKEAVLVAENHIAQKKIDISQHYLASLHIGSDKRGQLHWDAQWMLTNSTIRGGWFIIRVEMDKAAKLVPGK
jgi:hypothetical protein